MHLFFIISVITYLASYELLYFSISESILMGISVALSYRYLTIWYKGATFAARFFKSYTKGLILYILPCIILFLYSVTLHTAASYDVVSAGFYIIMYTMLGIAWLYLTLQGMFLFFDFSYRDDVLTSNHTAPFITCVFACLAIALIYAGANIGDGPGWWTVVFAGGLGTVSWLLLGSIVHRATRLVDRVIKDKEIAGSIRLGSYLLAAGMILGVASSGDWTSFGATVIEFGAGWPVLPLTLLVIALERTIFSRQVYREGAGVGTQYWKSILVSLIYLLIAFIKFIPPLANMIA